MATPATSNSKLNKDAFIEGVDHILAKWTALALAVENEWGGSDTEDKRENMVDEVVEFFNNAAAKRQRPEPTDLEAILLDIMTEDFNISLEDGSEKEVAARLTAIFIECINGNHSTVNKLAEEREAREARDTNANAVKRSQAAARPDADGSESSSEDDDSDSDDAMDED
ncbi:rRNA accumulation- protein [Kickxella alabastrina]|uniref:rRNA accumulation- protein n=1 Tax=Kickxella alabastrina TaxID=61397 RepID=A0ACC1IFG5_9FUNG|nr:rRNA accumulation- protein [Kickxella alabastrina]